MSATISRILFIDDEPDIRRILSATLEITMSAEVVTFASAQEAFAHLDGGPLPDLILLDGQMPEMDGLTACRALRADSRYQSIPIIFLSGRSDPHEQREALAAGATGYLSKPFDPMTIGNQIMDIVNTTR
ncbi:MAG: response regulator [Myxococcota bacterium]